MLSGNLIRSTIALFIPVGYQRYRTLDKEGGYFCIMYAGM